MSLSPAATHWLQEILSTRLGAPVTLEAGAADWVLRARGAEGGLRFARRLDLRPGSACEGCNRIPWPAETAAVPGLTDLVAPGCDVPPAPLVSPDPGGLHVAYDVPGLIFRSLARIEEIGRADAADAHGRFRADAAHAVTHGYLDRPVVDEWILLLGALARRIWPSLASAPPAHPPLELSHDVDTPTRYGFTTPVQLARRMAGDLRRGMAPGLVARAPLMRAAAGRRLPEADPANRFDWLMDISASLGVASTFYFITHPHPHPSDPRYPFDAPSLAALRARMTARGHEIGLHPSYGSYRDPAQIAREADILRAAEPSHPAPGARMHYLQWEAWGTSAALARAGLSHDATLGYAERPGFRAGTSHPYPAFDPVADRALGITMRPLIVMEQSLLSPNYLGLSPADALDTARSLRAAAHRVGGTFSVLWHNDMLSTGALRDLYAGFVGA